MTMKRIVRNENKVEWTENSLKFDSELVTIKLYSIPVVVLKMNLVVAELKIDRF